MKVTYNWLKDFVEIKIPAQELAEKLTMAGLEVTSLEAKGGDFVFEIEVTSNRPDWLSVLGIAREAAAITGAKLKKEGAKPRFKTQSFKSGFKIQIEDKKDCSLYAAKIIKGVKVGASPEWLRKRLELVGCRSVNNIVDITNYVMFELGEPLHAFDLRKLSGDTIIVRRSMPGEKIITIDGSQKGLDADILVIADSNKPVAVAGVMGGRDTEVSWDSRDILLEAALFDPVLVRRGRQRLALNSESSYRFERGVDPQLPQRASRRALELIQEFCGGECVLAESAGGAGKQPAAIQLNPPKTKEILGANIPPAKIKGILTSLGFTVKQKAKNNLKVIAPSYRQDVKSEIDLVEEVARVYGYNKIPTTIPKVSPNIGVSQPRDMISLLKDILVGLGLNEVITYSLVDRATAADCGCGEPIEVLNPLSAEQAALRPTVAIGLLKCVAYNLNQKQDYVNIFEVSKIFKQHPCGPREDWVLAVALCGLKTFFMAQKGLAKEEAGLGHLKGIVEAVFGRLGIKDYDFFSQDDGAIAIRAQGEKIGAMLEAPRPVLERFEIKNKEVVLLEVHLGEIFSRARLKRQFLPLPKYPEVTRDISLLLKDEIKAAEILSAVREKAGHLLEEARVADYYKGRQIPDGYKGLTISCVYRSNERTLTEAEINPLHSAICGFLSDKFGAKIR